MPVLYPAATPATVIFEGRCAPEEADMLLDWLRRTAAPSADLSACTEPHTALVQLLLAARVHLAAPPADSVLADCLAAHLPAAPPDIGAGRAPRRRAPRKSSPSRSQSPS